MCVFCENLKATNCQNRNLGAFRSHLWDRSLREYLRRGVRLKSDFYEWSFVVCVQAVTVSGRNAANSLRRYPTALSNRFRFLESPASNNLIILV